MPKTFGIKIAGPQGSGIQSAGETLYRAAVKAGFYALGYLEYNSLIKGGHSSYLLTLSDTPNPNISPTVDLFIPLTKSSYDRELPSTTKDTHFIVDSSFKIEDKKERFHESSLIDIAKNQGNPLILNTIALGFLSHQLKFPKDLIINLVLEDLSGKSQTLLDQNKKGYEEALRVSSKYFLGLWLPNPNNATDKLVVTGSQAIGDGAIAAGLNFFAGYPMTPSSPVLHYLSAKQEKNNFLVKQTEDEISAINMAIGASYAGAKSMTGTSGGGFALMQEGISLAGMVETPLVIYLAMRPGPATGLPTWTSQADLLFAVHSGHGEFSKIVLAPGDPIECFLLTHRAFQLSQSFHIPVIVISDKYLAENHYCLEKFPELNKVPLSINLPGSPETYQRYNYSPTGVSQRTIPGILGGEYIANSDEHTPDGLVDESSENRKLMNQRRQNKHTLIEKNIPLPEIIYNSDTALVTWGSTKFIGREIANSLSISHIHFSYIYPFPSGLTPALSKFTKIFVLENNLTGQFAKLLRSEIDIKITKIYGEDDGRPLNPKYFINQIKNEL